MAQRYYAVGGRAQGLGGRTSRLKTVSQKTTLAPLRTDVVALLASVDGASYIISMARTLAETMLYTTVKVSTFADADPTGTGTAFFWRTVIPDRGEVVTLVTNRHVIDGATRIIASCHVSDGQDPKGPSGRFVNCQLILDPGDTIYHPEADLCAIPFGTMLVETEAGGMPLFMTYMDASIVPNEAQWRDFDAFEEVIMVGCPRGIFDQANNLPISRRGLTATALGSRYENRDEFLVDMACFPGSSGSPVFVYSQLGYLDRQTNSYQLGQGRFFFVGILYAGPLITNEGRIVLSQQPTIEVASMMHLGQVIRSSAMLEIDGEILRRVAAGAIS